MTREQPDVYSKSFIKLQHPPPLIKPIWLAKFVINILLSIQENYAHELEIHERVLVSNESESWPFALRFRAVVISPHSSFGLIKSSTATQNIAIKPAQKWCCCNSSAFRFCLYIFQAFIMFSQPTGALVELLWFDQFEASTSLPPGTKGTAEQGSWGSTCPPPPKLFFKVQRVSMKVTCAPPPPHLNIESLMCPPPQKKKKISKLLRGPWATLGHLNFRIAAGEIPCPRDKIAGQMPGHVEWFESQMSPPLGQEK